ncbi:MAG TPA: glycerophosphodiester phosphodiesterase family protein [Microbacterium sp.]|nr:glycerophosphodiester phosphodiesterase family protein [Microbacterium sp.]
MAQHSYLDGTRFPRVLAHRGLVTDEMRADGIAENTMAAFAAAHAAGAEFIETDCHLTADGEVVLFHDDTLERVAGDARAIAEISLCELEEIMAARGGIATLAQALAALPDVRFNVDVKAEGAAERAGAIVADAADRVLLTSFSDRRRRRAVRAAISAGGRPATSPGRTTIALLIATTAVAPLRPLARPLLRGIDALQIPERQGAVRVLTPELLRTAHAAGTEVHVWTVNEPDEMRRLVRSGVDGIVTDRADAALEALHP